MVPAVRGLALVLKLEVVSSNWCFAVDEEARTLVAWHSAADVTAVRRSRVARWPALQHTAYRSTGTLPTVRMQSHGECVGS